MRARCRNDTRRNRPWAGNGVTVCKRWGKFAAFIDDMGPRPDKQHSLDRIDPFGNYEPSNCRWATIRQQLRNKRNAIYVVIDGERKLLMDAAAEHGIKRSTAYRRVTTHGWDPIEGQ